MEVSKQTCKIHGEYDAPESVVPMLGKRIGTFCPKCVEAEKQDLVAQELSRMAKERGSIRLEGAMKRAGIPPRFATKTFDNFDAVTPEQDHALSIATRYAAAFDQVLETGRSMIFTGLTGTGKTHLATAIANDVMRRNYSAGFTTVRELVGRVKETWNRKAERTEAQVIRDFVLLDLLILDEVGVQFDSDSERMILFDVINGRYESMRPTIVLSNYPLVSDNGPSIRKVLGDRVVDRLREGGGTLVTFGWESYRKVAQ